MGLEHLEAMVAKYFIAMTSGKPLIYFSMLFMLFHAFLSKKSTLFEKY